MPTRKRPSRTAPRATTVTEAGERTLHAPGWPRPKGYTHGIVADGPTVFLSGIVGWDANGQFAGDDLVSQTRQALRTIVVLLQEAGSRPSDIVRMTWYVVSKREYLAAQRELGAAYRDVIGRHFPAMTVVEVSALLEDRARVEIEVTAVKR
jgi:enamine deaminase RidA (YjgF/YER057c/UK114 family)